MLFSVVVIKLSHQTVVGSGTGIFLHEILQRHIRGAHIIHASTPLLHIFASQILDDGESLWGGGTSFQMEGRK